MLLLPIFLSIWPTIPLLLSLAIISKADPPPSSPPVQLLSSSAESLSLVAGLTARFQCSVYRCGPNPAPPSLCWYKDDILLFNGTEFEPTSGVEPSRIILQRSMDSGGGANSCLGEEFTLLLRNLSLQDSGKYSCQLWGMTQQLDFNLNVIEGELKLNFSSLTYDHTECCIELGVSPLCRPMCRPRDMGDEFFDPTSCQVDDYRNFLHCATDNGKRDYLPCCRQKALPPFCFDFCSNNFQTMKKAHRLCLYYLPEIFDCFSRQFALQPPPAPNGIRLKEGGKAGRQLCWRVERTANRAEEANAFIVHLREMPEMPKSVEEKKEEPINFGKRRTRRAATTKSAGRTTTTVTLVQENRNSQQAVFTKMPVKGIDGWGTGSEASLLLCIPLEASLRKGGRYLIFIQASNEHGNSDPSKPFFIAEDGQSH